MIDSYSVNWISNQIQEYNGMVVARSHYARLYVLDFITGTEISTTVLSAGSEGGCGIKDGLVYISSGHYVVQAATRPGQPSQVVN